MEEQDNKKNIHKTSFIKMHTKDYYTIGKLVDGVVLKSRWLTPELIVEEKIEDSLDNCFEEAIIYNHARKTNR